VQAPNERVALLWLEGGTRTVEPLDYVVDETLRAKVRLDAAESKRILTIAEPEGAWSATVNGKTLASAPAYTDAWRQAWVVPAGADGNLVVSFQHGQRLGAISFQLLILIIALVIALPTYRPYADEDADGEVVSA
jgi:arabinofuranan 3-O-arabinosyltransferase